MSYLLLLLLANNYGVHWEAVFEIAIECEVIIKFVQWGLLKQNRKDNFYILTLLLDIELVITKNFPVVNLK